MLNTNPVFVLLILITFISCKSIAQTSDKIYRFESKESGIFNATFRIEEDSTIRFSGGKGGYRYWGYGKLEKISPIKFLMNQEGQGGVKVETVDEFKRKVNMMDSANDTLYFYGGDTAFVYKNRIFKLEENP